jgi:anti-anti-sigma factor
MGQLTPDDGATVSVEHGDAGSTVTLAGEFDLTNVALLEQALAPLVGDATGGGASIVVLELADLAFMDSSVLAVLIRAAVDGATLELRNPSPIMREVLVATGLDELMRVVP